MAVKKLARRKPTSALDKILAMLKGVSGDAGQYSACCPAHSDRKQSLSINTGDDGRVLLNCHVGCTVEEITEAMGCTVADLFGGADTLTVERLAAAKGMPLDFLESLGVVQQNGHVLIRYRLADGTDAPRHRIRSALRAKDGSRWTVGEGESVPYGLDRLSGAADAGQVMLVEGETDCWTAWLYGLPALGLPGASTASKLQVEHLAGIETVFIHHEPDNGGDNFVEGLTDRLRTIGFQGKVAEFRLPAKDLNELHQQYPKQFKAKLKAALKSATVIDLKAWPEVDHQQHEALPFPVDVLPATIAKFAEQVSRSIGCPTDFVGVPILVCAGAAIGNSRAVLLKKGWAEGPRLYGGCVGNPGTAKSPAINAVVEPFTEAQLRFRYEWDAEMEEHKIRLESWEATKREGKNPGPRPTAPKLRRVTASDTTVEALGGILSESPRGILLHRDELTAWSRSMNQYRGGKGTDRQFWLQAWSGQAVTIDRKNNPVPLMLPNPFVSVIGGLTPEMLTELMEEHGRSDGSLERLLIAWPEHMPTAPWTEDGVSQLAKDRWTKAVDWLLNLDGDGTTPVILPMTRKAKTVWKQWIDSHNRETDEPNLLPSLQGTWSKMRGHCARLALIIQLLRAACGEAKANEVDEVSVRAAIRLVDYFKSHAVCVHRYLVGRFGGLSADAYATITWAQRGGLATFSERDLWEDMRNRFGSREHMGKVLKELQGRGWIRSVRSQASKRTGRQKSPAYELNPTVLAQAH